MLFGLLKPRIASAFQEERSGEPPLRPELKLPVHVVADNAKLHISDGLLQIESEDDNKAVRIDEVSVLAIHGSASVTTPCIATLAQAGVPITFHSRNGYYLAQIIDLSSSQSKTRRAHYAAVQSPRAVLSIAKELIGAKILNAHRMTRRRFGSSAKIVKRLKRDAKNALRAKSLASLRGVEGSAAAGYWGVWNELIRTGDDLFVFAGRTRRPPRDNLNALLSYLYAVICGNCAAAALSAGLDPTVGFLHSERPGRPALALDMAEPLRTAIIDTAVIAAINNGEFGSLDFVQQPDGSVRLSDAGRRLALTILERRLSTSFSYEGTEMTWRAAISYHAQYLAKCVRNERANAPAPRLL